MCSSSHAILKPGSRARGFARDLTLRAVQADESGGVHSTEGATQTEVTQLQDTGSHAGPVQGLNHDAGDPLLCSNVWDGHLRLLVDACFSRVEQQEPMGCAVAIDWVNPGLTSTLCASAGSIEGGGPLRLPGSTPPGFDTPSSASDPVLVPSAPSAPPALMPGVGGLSSSAFNNDPTVDRAMFDRLRTGGRSLEEVRWPLYVCGMGNKSLLLHFQMQHPNQTYAVLNHICDDS